MESKQLYSTTTANDFENVKNVVEMVMGSSIFISNRQRLTVETRMIAASMLRDMGYSLNEIGRYMRKDHSTIIHYSKTIKSLVETDQTLLKKYLKCKELLLIKEQPSEEEVALEDFRFLKLKVELLEKENEMLAKENKELIKKKNVRLSDIFKLIEEYTPPGMEFLIERKLRKIFNE